MPTQESAPRFSPRRSLALAAIVVVCFFAGLEVVLRLVGVESTTETPRILARQMDVDITFPFMHGDPELFWSPVPGFEGEFLGKRLRVNRLGLRGPEPPQARGPGTRRVVCFGDSITFGYGVGEDETYSHYLGQRLAPRGVAVVNAGVTGYTSHQVLGLLQRVGPALQPDVVTVLICWNDQNRRHSTDRSYQARFRQAAAIAATLDHLYLYRAISAGYRALARSGARRPTPRDTVRVLPDEYRENLERIVAVCVALGAKPAFIAFTGRHARGQAAPEGRYPGILAEVARAHGVAVLDSGPLAATAPDGNEPLFIDSLHFSPAGAELLARELAAQLLARGIV